jgi:hypothetical protein
MTDCVHSSSDHQTCHFELIRLLVEFLDYNHCFQEKESLGCREASQPPIFGVVLSFDPLVITDETFQHSLKLSGFSNIKYKNEDLEESTYCIELIDWKWRVFLNKYTSEYQEIEDLLEASCSSFRIWKETGNIIEVDLIPPPLVHNTKIKEMIRSLSDRWNSSILRERTMAEKNMLSNINNYGRMNDRKIKQIQMNEETTESSASKRKKRDSFDSFSSETLMNQKENLPLARSAKKDDKDHKMYLFKKSCVLRGHPVLIKIKERSRSTSPSRGLFSKTSEVISVISDTES